jgi:hypothetical protein
MWFDEDVIEFACERCHVQHAEPSAWTCGQCTEEFCETCHPYCTIDGLPMCSAACAGDYCEDQDKTETDTKQTPPG